MVHTITSVNKNGKKRKVSKEEAQAQMRIEYKTESDVRLSCIVRMGSQFAKEIALEEIARRQNLRGGK